VRRYRAERLLRDEFERLRDSVIGSVCGRLRAAGVRLDASDVDAAYAQAWQGLYAATLEGQQIVNPSGWLALVTYRRAIDEHRARWRMQCAALPAELEEPDLAAELDDRTRLRQLFEALRGRLNAREQQAATLCYLQGLSRSEAAARMGVSESRMRKLMEGRDAGSPGVAGKVGALVETIRAGAWCEEQGSLMRGFAYGILDPDGQRYGLALIHRDECPACRAYVLSLRGLAAVLPPVPLLLQLTFGVGAGAGTGVAASGAGTASGTGAGIGTGVGTGAAAPTSAGVGALSASGAAGAAGAAGGGWWLAGPLGAKLAVGCLLAVGVGAGCVALDGPGRGLLPAHRRLATRDAHANRPTSAYQANRIGLAAESASSGETPSGRLNGAAGAGATIGSAARATREFGPEQSSQADTARSNGSPAPSAPRATASSAGRLPAEGTPTSSGPTAASGPTSVDETSSGASSGAAPAAQREFSPG
jgi:RNA polymerase sigma factor (sigma-70 family)